jgi:hypothetical protein
MKGKGYISIQLTVGSSVAVGSGVEINDLVFQLGIAQFAVQNGTEAVELC